MVFELRTVVLPGRTAKKILATVLPNVTVNAETQNSAFVTNLSNLM